MKRGAVAVFAAMLLLGAAPAPSLSLGPSVSTFKLPGGGNAIVRRLGGAPVAAVELWFRAPSIGFETTPQPGLARLAAYAVAASQPLTGTVLGSVIARAGGRFGISVYPQTIAISALVPASAASSVLRTMSAVYFTPVLTPEGLMRAVTTVRQDARLRAIASPEETLRDSLFAALFVAGPNHFSPAGEGSDPSKLTLEEVRAFATRAFRASNVTLVLTGAVDAQLAEAAVEGRTDAGTSELLISSADQIDRSGTTLTRPGPIAGFGYAWAGPPISSEAEATALDFVADYLFNADTGTVPRALAGIDAAVNAQYVTYFNPGVLYVEATGGQAPRARPTIDAALAAIRKPLDPVAFAAARNVFEYHVTSDVASPISLADNFGWYASEGSAGYAPGADPESGRYVRSIRALTPEFVAATVGKYLTPQHVTVMLAVGSLNTPPPSPSPAPSSSP